MISPRVVDILEAEILIRVTIQKALGNDSTASWSEGINIGAWQDERWFGLTQLRV